MNTIKNNTNNELIINKSKFITNAFKVKDIIECKSIINDIKEKYKDATHNCYAYVIDNVKRFNDDGEPSGTAGMPILNVIESNELNHILIIVTRYFGGIKLGAGGLLRAYSNSASETLKKTDIIEEKEEIKVKIEFSYDNTNNVNYILKDYNITYKEYNDNITYEFICEKDNYPNELDKYIIKKDV